MKNKPPERIYLQWYTETESDTKTWCEDQINEDDTLYTRNPLFSWKKSNEELPNNGQRVIVMTRFGSVRGAYYGVGGFHEDTSGMALIAPYWMHMPLIEDVDEISPRVHL